VVAPSEDSEVPDSMRALLKEDVPDVIAVLIAKEDPDPKAVTPMADALEEDAHVDQTRFLTLKN